ncbi:DNA repair protein rad52 [Basidiobolus ranarum]|uniref:DNA repair protein rad52 n=1 Tax=Basidiobolus ranarum TaxID=34480 RepID=A0ABR2WYE1_9FUNG
MNRKLGEDRNSTQEQYHVNSHNSQTQASFGRIPFTSEEFRSTKRTLSMQLGPEYVSTRAAFGGTRVAYLEGWKSINLANDMFGFNGWSSTIIDYTVDYLDVTDTGRVSLGMSCIMRVTLKDGTYHEDIGYGNIDNAKSKSQAFEKVKKEAATDALKRALRTFGNSLGNCLYDKNFLKQIARFKPPVVKPLELENLFHHDSVDSVKREEASMHLASKPNLQSNATPSSSVNEEILIKQEPLQSENFGFEDSDELFAQMADTYEFFANRSNEVETPGRMERDAVTTEVIPANILPSDPTSTHTPGGIRKRPKPCPNENETPVAVNERLNSAAMVTPIQNRVQSVKSLGEPGGHKQYPTPPSTLMSISDMSKSKSAVENTPVPSINNNPRRVGNMFSTSSAIKDGSGTDGESSSGDSSHAHTPSMKGLKRQNGTGVPLFRPPLHPPTSAPVPASTSTYTSTPAPIYTDRREIEMPSGSKVVKKTRTDIHNS